VDWRIEPASTCLALTCPESPTCQESFELRVIVALVFAFSTLYSVQIDTIASSRHRIEKHRVLQEQVHAMRPGAAGFSEGVAPRGGPVSPHGYCPCLFIHLTPERLREHSCYNSPCSALAHVNRAN
jgi:hypothetical protein